MGILRYCNYWNSRHCMLRIFLSHSKSQKSTHSRSSRTGKKATQKVGKRILFEMVCSIFKRNAGTTRQAEGSRSVTLYVADYHSQPGLFANKPDPNKIADPIRLRTSFIFMLASLLRKYLAEQCRRLFSASTPDQRGVLHCKSVSA